MTTSISSEDLFRAILAMDAYNHGYNQGVYGLSDVGFQLGNATLDIQSDTDPTHAAVAASFYAAAYSWNGETIISYRGTDGLLPSWLGGDVPSDVGDWAIAISGEYSTTQGLMASEFYRAVDDAAGRLG